jgi:phosphohistidine phosphatase SixA
MKCCAAWLLLTLSAAVSVRAVEPLVLVAPGPDEHLVIVLRHAEKATDDPRDPGLSAAGHARAEALAGRLAGVPLAAVYATPYRRTQQTAAPVARQHGLEVVARAFASDNPDEDARQLRHTLLARHRGAAVLVVGHSNTVPALVAALSGRAIDPMDDDEYDRLSIIRLGADGAAQFERLRY